MLFVEQMKLSHSYNMLFEETFLFRFIVDRPVPQPYPVHVKVPVYQTQFVEKHGMYNYLIMSIRHYSICGSLCANRFGFLYSQLIVQSSLRSQHTLKSMCQCQYMLQCMLHTHQLHILHLHQPHFMAEPQLVTTMADMATFHRSNTITTRCGQIC